VNKFFIIFALKTSTDKQREITLLHRTKGKFEEDKPFNKVQTCKILRSRGYVKIAIMGLVEGVGKQKTP